MGAARPQLYPDEPGPACSAAVVSGLISGNRGTGERERILRRFLPEVNDREKERERRLSEELDASDATALARALFPVVSYQEHLEEQKNRSPGAIANTAPGPELTSIPEDTKVLPCSGGNDPKDIDTTDAVSDSVAQSSLSESTAVSSEVETKPSPTVDDAVEEAVRGVYRLWLSRARTATNTSMTAEKCAEAFLALVTSAISSA